MGNTTSCAPSITSGGVVKVICNDGRVETYSRPIKAAELMLENPRQFVCDSIDLKVGKRIQGLAADEDLERRGLYFLLPMEMLYSVLTNEEMKFLSYKASKLMMTNNIGRRIFPVLGEFYCIFPSEVKKTIDLQQEAEETCVNPETLSGRTYSKQRSWKPALDTIAETPYRR